MSESSDVVRALRRCQPVSIRAHLADDTVRELAPPGGKRKRWSHVVDMLSRISWVQLELLNPKGQTIEVVENDAPAEELEDIQPAQSGQTAAMLGLMLRAQDVALRRNSEQVKELVGMNLRLCEVLISRLVALEKGYAANLNLAQKFAAHAARSDDGDGGGLLSDGPIAELAPFLAGKLLGVPPEVMLSAMRSGSNPDPDPDPEPRQ